MSNSTRAIVVLCLLAFVAACAPKQQEIVYADQPLTVEPVSTGKYK
ncbi:MAG: hypothetical protein Q8P60_05045 [Pseudorhodobacter sp.]|nr:hypothetical protein [Pseudorhodobacter sp.]